MGIKRTFGVAVAANSAAAVLTAEVTAGNIINDRLVKVIANNKATPMMVKMVADTPWFKIAAANAVAAGLIHTLPNNEKAMRAADAMIKSAMLEFGASFDIEGMVDDLIDGVDFGPLNAVSDEKQSDNAQ